MTGGTGETGFAPDAESHEVSAYYDNLRITREALELMRTMKL